MADEQPDEKPGSPPRKRAPRKKASPQAAARRSTTTPAALAAPTAPAGPEFTSQEIAELERLRTRLVTKFTGRR